VLSRSGLAAFSIRIRVIPVAGQLSLGPDVPPGAYTLQVNVGAERRRRASQGIEVR
jgi:hypothetical protein